MLTEHFGSDIGLRQGNNLSLNLFSCYINYLLKELKEYGPKLKIHCNEVANVLAYVDDLVLLANNECDMQKLLDIVTNWCNKWMVLINGSKSKVVEFKRCCNM